MKMPFHHLNLKTALAALILVLIFTGNSLADPQYYNYQNVGEEGNSWPFEADGGKAVNWLFLPGEFNQPTPLPADNITAVYFFLAQGGSRTYTDLTIKMAQSDITTLTSGQFYPGPWVTVYSNPSVTLSGSSLSWLGPITLDTPFPYDPTKSLILAVEQSGATGSGIQLRQLELEVSDIRRVWSLGGYPFTPYPGGDDSIVNFGVDVKRGAAIPTLTHWGMMAVAAILGLLGFLRVRRRRNR